MSDIAEKLNTLPSLSRGSHKSIEEGMCLIDGIEYIPRTALTDNAQALLDAAVDLMNDSYSDHESEDVLCARLRAVIAAASAQQTPGEG